MKDEERCLEMWESAGFYNHGRKSFSVGQSLTFSFSEDYWNLDIVKVKLIAKTVVMISQTKQQVEILYDFIPTFHFLSQWQEESLWMSQSTIAKPLIARVSL